MGREKHNEKTVQEPKNKRTRKKKASQPDDSPVQSSPPRKDDLRPRTLEFYVGQKRVVTPLRDAVSAAKLENRPLDHVLLSGPPGLGKTTLARCLAREMDGNLIETTGSSLTSKGDLLAYLTKLGDGDVMFIDEIHGLARNLEEMLHSAMEDNCYSIVLDSGPNGRIVNMHMESWTLIGATTRRGDVSEPIYNRFTMKETLEPYEDRDLATIVGRNAEKLGVNIDIDGAIEIAERSRGTPRISNQLLRRVRDVAVTQNIEEVSRSDIIKALDSIGVDALGLDRLSRRYLASLATTSPSGLKTLAAALNEDEGTIERSVEPYLLRKGMVRKTSRGREITALGRGHHRHSIVDVE